MTVYLVTTDDGNHYGFDTEKKAWNCFHEMYRNYVEIVENAYYEDYAPISWTGIHEDFEDHGYGVYNTQYPCSVLNGTIEIETIEIE